MRDGRTISDADGPLVAKDVYEALMKEAVIDLDAIPYALDAAVRKLRAMRVPLHRWAAFVHMGA